MSQIRRIAASLAIVLPLAAGTAAAQTATQDVSFEVQAVNQLEFAGSPSLVISSPAVGGGLTAVTASATYNVTTNDLDRKITAALDSDMPTGLTLSASLTAPAGATSAGNVQLSTTAQDVVTGISTVNASALDVTYTLSADATAGVVPSSSRTVTYTITAGA